MHAVITRPRIFHHVEAIVAAIRLGNLSAAKPGLLPSTTTLASLWF